MNKAFILAISAFAAIVAKADVMNWQVADDSLADYNYAKLYYVDGNTTVGGTELATSTLEEGYGDVVQIDLASVIGAGANSMYYYIEVGNYNDNTFQAVQRAGAYSYNDLVSAGLISTGSMNPPSGKSFGQSGVTIAGGEMSYGNVPEPSSAMLILLGLAVAGLKRRRA